MKRKTNYFLIGVFVLTGTFLTIAGVVMLGAGTFARRGLVVESYFTESVQGLETGAIVRFRGVRIGTVTEIALVSQLYDTDKEYAAVRCHIEPSEGAPTPDAIRAALERQIAEGFRMRLASQGITGAAYIETDVAPPEATTPIDIDWKPDYFTMPSASSRIEQLGSSFERVLANLSATDVAGLVEDARRTLRRVDDAIVAADFGSFGREVSAVAASARETLDSARTEFSRLSDRIQRTADRADAVLSAVPPEDMRRALTAITTFAEELPSTRARLDAALVEAERVLGELRGEVSAGSRDVGEILANLRRAALHLANLSETAERYPSLLFLGAPPPPSEMDK